MSKTLERKGSFDAARKKVIALLQGKTLEQVQVLRCIRCPWRQQNRPCVWPEGMCRLARKPRKNSENT